MYILLVIFLSEKHVVKKNPDSKNTHLMVSLVEFYSLAKITEDDTNKSDCLCQKGINWGKENIPYLVLNKYTG